METVRELRDTNRLADSRRGARISTTAADRRAPSSPLAPAAGLRDRLAAPSTAPARRVHRVAIAIAQCGDRRTKPVHDGHPAGLAGKTQPLAGGAKSDFLEVGWGPRLDGSRGESLRVGEIQALSLAAAGSVGAEGEHGDVPREAQPARRSHAGGVERHAAARGGLLPDLIQHREGHRAAAHAKAFAGQDVAAQKHDKNHRDDRRGQHQQHLLLFAPQEPVVDGSDENAEGDQDRTDTRGPARRRPRESAAENRARRLSPSRARG